MNTHLLAQATLDFAGQAADQELPGADAATAEEGFSLLLGGLLADAMTIGAVILLIYLVWGAIQWITSGGDKGKVESARNKITQAIIGMIILAATTALFGIVQEFLGVCIIDIGGVCANIGTV